MIHLGNKFYGNKLQYVASVGSGYQHQKGYQHKNRFDVSSKLRPFVGPDEGPLLKTSNLFLSPR